jgi:hypothetical protein
MNKPSYVLVPKNPILFIYLFQLGPPDVLGTCSSQKYPIHIYYSFFVFTTKKHQLRVQNVAWESLGNKKTEQSKYIYSYS